MNREFNLKNWSSLENFSEELVLEDQKLYLNGFSSQHDSYGRAIGAAVGLEESREPYAYFEFLERVAIQEARGSCENFILLNSQGKTIGKVANRVVFEQSPTPLDWIYSVSNGTAIHETFALACQKAREELIERDLLLRSWLGNGRPQKLEIQLNTLSWKFLKNSYRLETYRFPSIFPMSQVPCVTCTIGIPLESSKPFVYGFGCHEGEEQSVEHSIRECLQRYGFMWDQPINKCIPKFSPTPEFHLEYFHSQWGLGKIREWLMGEHRQANTKFPDLGEVNFVDITPMFLKGKFFVIKAMGDNFMQLYFGRKSAHEKFGFHPVA